VGEPPGQIQSRCEWKVEFHTRRNGAPSAALTRMGTGRGSQSYRKSVGLVREGGGAGANAGMSNSGMSGGRLARTDEENIFQRCK
jgi:hypothetical protein